MNTTANDTTTIGAQPLSWTGKKEWGSEGNTYRAEADGWRYCVDSPKKGSWVLRGWGPDDRFLYRDGFTTMKSAKAAAGDHLDEYRAAMQSALDTLKQLPAATSKIVAELAALPPLISNVAKSARAAHWALLRPDGCHCPTPTHTMRCGHGGRPLVRKPLVVVLVDEGAELLRKPCTECGRVTNHKLDCSKGRNL